VLDQKSCSPRHHVMMEYGSGERMCVDRIHVRTCHRL